MTTCKSDGFFVNLSCEWWPLFVNFISSPNHKEYYASTHKGISRCSRYMQRVCYVWYFSSIFQIWGEFLLLYHKPCLLWRSERPSLTYRKKKVVTTICFGLNLVIVDKQFGNFWPDRSVIMKNVAAEYVVYLKCFKVPRRFLEKLLSTTLFRHI